MADEQNRGAAEAALQELETQVTERQAAFRERVQAAAARQGVSVEQAGTYVPAISKALAPLPGSDTPAEHLSVAGLQHRLTRQQEAAASITAAMREAVITARKSGYTRTDEDRDAALEALGLDPLQEVTVVTIPELSFQMAGKPSKEDIDAQVTAAFQGLLGDGMTVTKVNARVRQEVI